MSTQKSLSLSDRLESTHPTLSHPGRFMRLLCPIILTLFSAVDCLRHQLSMRYSIASQFVSHDLPRFISVVS
jgi:hypothetical protein